MASYSIEGIVLRHADYRENDRMLTLLTPRGRVDARENIFCFQGAV